MVILLVCCLDLPLLCRAAETIGCRVHGITLSKEQMALAQEKVRRYTFFFPLVCESEAYLIGLALVFGWVWFG